MKNRGNKVKLDIPKEHQHLIHQGLQSQEVTIKDIFVHPHTVFYSIDFKGEEYYIEDIDIIDTEIVICKSDEAYD